MKVRSNFVSNSSSSSYIVTWTKKFRDFVKEHKEEIEEHKYFSIDYDGVEGASNIFDFMKDCGVIKSWKEEE